MKGLRARIHALWLVLVSEHRAPGRVAAAVLVGAMVGCTPLFGFHILVCLVLAWALRLNKVIVYAAANLSIPPLVPFIGFASVQLGERIRNHHFLPANLALFRVEPARVLAARFFWSWMVGGTVLGATLGAIGGATAYVFLRRRHELVVDPIRDAIELARHRYDREPGRFKWYARMKYMMDPCYRAIAAHVRPGTFTVDLGTGLGMLPVLLGLLGERQALGIEWDAAKAEAGQRAAAGLAGIGIVTGDAREYPLPPCDVVTVVDVLHYYDDDTQRRVLARCRAALRPGGVLLVREGDGARVGGSRFTRAVEQTVTKLGWNRGPAVRFRPITELETELRELGFTVERDEVAGTLHPGNVLLVARVP
ncbi:MAG: DUF2062 domain-containing protein [Polyangia bacterium]